MEPPRPITVAAYLTRGDAEVARAVLAAAGIPAAIRADDEGGLNPGFFADYRVRLEVTPDRIEEARSLLGEPEQVHVPHEVIRVVVSHARRCLPEEGCGLLEGDAAGNVLAAHPTENVAHSPSRFTVDPVAHHALWRRAEEAGHVLVGSFHSHPAAAAVPSATDIAGALDPEWLYLIVGPLNGTLEVRGYRIRRRQVDEVSLTIGSVSSWT
jgi:proteasome lid subunit RPN8/RPN11